MKSLNYKKTSFPLLLFCNSIIVNLEKNRATRSIALKEVSWKLLHRRPRGDQIDDCFKIVLRLFYDYEVK